MAVDLQSNVTKCELEFDTRTHKMSSNVIKCWFSKIKCETMAVDSHLNVRQWPLDNITRKWVQIIQWPLNDILNHI